MWLYSLRFILFEKENKMKPLDKRTKCVYFWHGTLTRFPCSQQTWRWWMMMCKIHILPLETAIIHFLKNRYFTSPSPPPLRLPWNRKNTMIAMLSHSIRNQIEKPWQLNKRTKSVSLEGFSLFLRVNIDCSILDAGCLDARLHHHQGLWYQFVRAWWWNLGFNYDDCSQLCV